MDAARDASAQTRPLSLFYALSQAGRAVAAARLEGDWQLKGHGLQVDDLGAADVCDVKVRPNPSKRSADSYAGVGVATESEVLRGPVSIGELWSSLPGLCLLIPPPDRKHLEPLGVIQSQDFASPLVDWRRVVATVAPLAGPSPEAIEGILSSYRHGRSATVASVQQASPIGEFTKHGDGIKVFWPAARPDFSGHWATLEEVAAADSYTGEHWLRPELDDGTLPSELMSWWALLYALSMLARYEPAAWSRALSYDGSPLAAPLGELLRVGVEIVPQIVLEALYPKELPIEG